MNQGYTVYVHEFPDGKTYVGLTKQSLEDRWQRGQGYKDQPVYKAILETGWDNINHHVVYTGLSREEARKREIELISKLDSVENGYNISPGGGCGGSSWITYEYNGTIYSPDELAKLSGIDGLSAHDITNRINYHHHTVEEAISTPRIDKNQKVEYNGELFTYRELADISTVNGLLPGDIRNRIKKGWDVERAITQPKNKKVQPSGVGKREYSYDGEMLNSFELWEKRKCIELTQFQIVDRIKHHGWNIEDAISKPPKKYGRLYEYEGNLYSTSELAKIFPENKLENHDITDRLRNGWSVKDAVEKPKRFSKK